MTTRSQDNLAQGLFDLALPPLALEGGGVVKGHRLRGWLWSGRDDLAVLAGGGVPIETDVPAGLPIPVRRDVVASTPLSRLLLPARPTVLLVHALTGDARAGGRDGWWEPLIGVGRPLDPRRYRIICFNNLGGCYGSSGPGDIDWPRNDDGTARAITSRDQARSLVAGLEALGIHRLHAVVGGSLGGMVALELAVQLPTRVERVVPIAACAASSAWVVGWNHVARSILALDGGPRGLELARQLAMLTYRAEPGLQQRHGRAQQGADRKPLPAWRSDAPYAVGSYLEHQGVKLRRRFETESYRLQLGAMDHHDLDRSVKLDVSAGEQTKVLGVSDAVTRPRIAASAFVLSIDTDALFTPEQSRLLAERLRQGGASVEEAQLASPHGHDAFLIEWSQLTVLLRRALALPAGV